MYQVKHIMYWSSADAPEVDRYFFKTKKNAEKLVEAFKKYYGNDVVSADGCKYPIESDSIYQRFVRIGKVETNDENIDEMCVQVKRLGTVL